MLEEMSLHVRGLDPKDRFVVFMVLEHLKATFRDASFVALSKEQLIGVLCAMQADTEIAAGAAKEKAYVH